MANEEAATRFLEQQVEAESRRNREYQVKSWLNKVYEVTQKELAAKMEVKEKLFAMITNGALDYSKERVQSSEVTGQEKRTIAYSEAAESVDRVKEKIAGLISERLMVINKVPGSEYRTILIQRYINTKNWGEIAGSMSYSVRHCHRLFDEAIKRIAPIVEDHLKGGETNDK